MVVGAANIEDLEFSEGLVAENVTQEMYNKVLEVYSNVILAQFRNTTRSGRPDLLCARQVSSFLALGYASLLVHVQGQLHGFHWTGAYFKNVSVFLPIIRKMMGSKRGSDLNF